jgi:menaquinone-specific isochorismate synthase
MNFTRLAIAPIEPSLLRARAARDGYLIESPEELRVGFGEVVASLALPTGVANLPDTVSFFATLSLKGDVGPRGTGIVAFASLPFDRTSPGRLDVPALSITQFADGRAWLTVAEGSPNIFDFIEDVVPPSQDTQPAVRLEYVPSGEVYARSVAKAVELLHESDLNKVVLARAVEGTVHEAIDPAAVAHRLRRRETACTIYALPVDGGRFVGASPELLVSREGAEATCHPLAGTIALPERDEHDDYTKWLLSSGKNLHEHALVVDDIASTLSSLYDTVDADERPSIVPLRTIAHLGSWVRARSNSITPPTAMALLSALHPTAAVGGLPRFNATSVLRELEGVDRGHFAGPVGWIDQNGDGDWWVGIRGVFLDGPSFRALAGAGIVAESDPVAERQETRDKLASILAAVLIDHI